MWSLLVETIKFSRKKVSQTLAKIREINLPRNFSRSSILKIKFRTKQTVLPNCEIKLLSKQKDLITLETFSTLCIYAVFINYVSIFLKTFYLITSMFLLCTNPEIKDQYWSIYTHNISCSFIDQHWSLIRTRSWCWYIFTKLTSLENV